MEAIDAFFGQNWVDQAQREHPIHPNTGCAMIECRDLPCEEVLKQRRWASITCLLHWSSTPQGYTVWFRRFNEFGNEPLNSLLR